MKYDVIIVGAGPGGIFSAYELMTLAPELKVAVIESGNELKKRRCPIDGDKIKSCVKCKSCAIMSGFGGAGAFSDGKYNITNDFGGSLYEYIGRKAAIDLMKYVDEINLAFGGEGTKMYSTAGSEFKTLCVQNKLQLLDASVRHLGTDINYVVLENLFAELEKKVTFFFDMPVDNLLGMPVLAKYFLRNGFKNDDLVIVSPDVGSVARTRAMASKFDAPMAIIDKRRPKANVMEVMNIIGDVKGKVCLMIDDMIDTAGTICQGAKALADNGAKEVYACCSHGVLSGPAIKRLEESVLKKVIILDTIQQPEDRQSEKIEQVTVADLFAEAIERIYSFSSVSQLYE